MEAGWLARFVDGLPEGADILDLGCGTGQPMARWLSLRGLAITGVDSSPAMLAHARSHLPRHEWLQADMRTLALGRAFDALLAWDSFFHLDEDDQRAMFRVFEDATPLVESWLSILFANGSLSWNILGTALAPSLTNAQIEDRKIYNTRMYSQSNTGHEFTDVLTDKERLAIIEYLKTL